MYLQHHGISGQKWGVRRYQNEDGSYTDLGRKHYGIGVGKFGDRRTPEQLVRKTIPSGSKFYRIQRSNAKALENQNGGVYVYNEKDRDNLRSIAPWISNTQGVTIDKLEEVELKTNKPIKVASQKDVDQSMIEWLKSDDQAINKIFDPSMISSVLRIQIPIDDVRSGKMSEKELSGYIKKELRNQLKQSPANNFINRLFSIGNQLQYATLKGDMARSDRYADSVVTSIKKADTLLKHIGDTTIDDPSISNVVAEGKSIITAKIASDSDIQSYIYNDLRKKGFTAMYDNNMINAGLTTRSLAEAHEPLILLDASSIEKTGSSTKMTKDILDSAEKGFQQYVNMQRKGSG